MRDRRINFFVTRSVGYLGLSRSRRLAGLFEVEEVAVYVELVDASVVGDGEDTIDFMAALAQGIDDKLDVYVIHGCQYRGNRLAGRE